MKYLPLLIAIVHFCAATAAAGELERTHRFGTPDPESESAWSRHVDYASWVDEETLVSWSKTGTLTCRKLNVERPLWEVKNLAEVSDWNVSRKTRRLALIRRPHNNINVFDCVTGKSLFHADIRGLEKVLRVDFPLARCVALRADDGRLIVTAAKFEYNRAGYLLDPTFRKVESSFHVDANPRCLRLSPDGATAVTVADDEVICVREIATDRELYFTGRRILKEPENTSRGTDRPFVSDARFDGKDTLIYAVDGGGIGSGDVYVKKLTEKEPAAFDARNGHIVMDVDFERRRIALTGTQAGLTVVDFAGKEIAHLPKATLQRNLAVEFSPSGKRIVVGSWDGTLSVFELKE